MSQPKLTSLTARYKASPAEDGQLHYVYPIATNPVKKKKHEFYGDQLGTAINYGTIKIENLLKTMAMNLEVP